MKRLPTKTKKTNKTGVTGVSVSGKYCHAYIVDSSGKRISSKFSTSLYGRFEALRLATNWRREQEMRIHGYSIIPEDFVLQNSKHKQSVARARNTLIKKQEKTLLERSNRQKEFHTRKANYKRLAGKFIYRIDSLELGHGWLLQIEDHEKLVCRRYFSDGQYGTLQDALIHAQQERQRLLALHDIPYAGGRRFSKKLRQTNSTGITGVCQYDCYYYCYIPVEPRKTVTRKISIAKYGEELAFRMAVDWRREKEVEIYGGTVLTNDQVEEVFQRNAGRQLP